MLCRPSVLVSSCVSSTSIWTGVTYRVERKLEVACRATYRIVRERSPGIFALCRLGGASALVPSVFHLFIVILGIVIEFIDIYFEVVRELISHAFETGILISQSAQGASY